MKLLTEVLALAGVLVLPVACGSRTEAATTSSGAGSVVEITAADRKAARLKFETLCFTCHGKTGAGDGPASKGLVPQPRDLQDPQWQQSVTDQHIETIIVRGGAAVGKALTMPPNPDLQSKPAVVAALREYVRGLNRDN